VNVFINFLAKYKTHKKVENSAQLVIIVQAKIKDKEKNAAKCAKKELF